MKNIPFVLIAFLFSASILSSCSKDPLKDMTQEESQIYITRRDSTVDFSDYHTFAIVDSVAIITNAGEGNQLSESDKELLQLITHAMEDRGYILVDTSDSPDLGLNVTKLSFSYLNVMPNDYYWGAPGYWNPGYWGYSGYDYYFPPAFGYYPPRFTYYQTQSDVISIDLLDLKNVTSKDKIEAVWNASLKGSGVLNARYYEQQINGIFAQSPYLKR